MAEINNIELFELGIALINAEADRARLAAETAAQAIVISKLNHENDELRARLKIAVKYEVLHKLRAGDFTVTVETGVQE